MALDWLLSPAIRLALGATLLCLAASTAVAQSVDVLGASDRDFSRPRDLVLSPDGDYLYVADAGNDAIKVLDPRSLETLGSFGERTLSEPHDVAFDGAGRLLVADSGNRRIAIFEVAGTEARLVGEMARGVAGVEGVAVGADGSVYVTSARRHTVRRFRDGIEVAAVGGYVRPYDVEVTADGRVVVADSGNHRLWVLDSALRVTAEVGGTAYGFNEPEYLTSDSRGRLYVVDKYNNRIVILDADYRPLAVIGAGGGGGALLHRPEGAEVAGRYLWVSDTGNNRIVLYRLRR